MCKEYIQTKESSTPTRWGLEVALVLLVYVVIQSFAITAPFFALDDNQQLAACHEMGSFLNALGLDTFQLFRPVKNLLFMILGRIADGGIWRCRMIALTIGVLSFFPVYGLMQRIYHHKGPALGAAAVWLLAPTLVSTVAWLSCLNIQVMCAAATGALLMHDWAFENDHIRKWRVIAAMIFLVLALLSYESAIVVGPAIMCFDFFLRPLRFRTRRVWMIYGCYAGISILYLLFRTMLGAADQVNGVIVGVPRVDLCLASAYFFCLHFGVWMFPFGQMAPVGSYYPGAVSTFVHCVSWTLVLSILVLPFVLRKRNPICAFGLAFAILAFLPVSNILGFGNGPYGDYYLALPSIGCALVLTSSVMWLLGVKGRGHVGALLVAVSLIALRGFACVEAAHWATLWGDGLAAFASGTRAQPLSYFNWMMLARVSSERGLFDLSSCACDEVERILGPDSEVMAIAWQIRTVNAIHGEKNAAKAFEYLAHAESCLRLDRPLDQAGRASPEKQYATRQKSLNHCNYYRGCIYEDVLGDFSKAEQSYQKALSGKWDLDQIAPADRLACLRVRRGDFVGAISLWERILKTTPNNSAVRHNLTLARRDMARNAPSK